jgi:TRAP-type C4-dicarboxylate transport system permease small subunit
MRLLMFIASVLVFPLTGLLFLQWPLRDWLQRYSREANDLGQILFALYVAVAIYAASRANTHLAAHATPAHTTRTPAPWRAWAALLCMGPWALFMLWASAGPTRDSVLGWERFPATFNPGYFVIKLALELLVLLVLLHALQAVWRNVRRIP